MKLGTHLLKGFDLLWVAVFGLGLGCALAVGVVCFGERSRKSLWLKRWLVKVGGRECETLASEYS